MRSLAFLALPLILRRLVGTLKARVVLVAVGSALAAGGVSTYYVSQQSQREALRTFMLQQADEAEIVAGLLASKVDLHLRSLRVFAGRLTEETLQQRPALQQALLGSGPLLAMFDGIYLINAAGEPLAAVQGGRLGIVPLAPPSVMAAMRRTLAQPNEVMAPPVVVRGEQDETRLAFCFAVRGTDGRLDGVIAGVVRPQSLLPSSLGTMGRLQSDLVVFAADGTILSHPDEARVGQPVAQVPGLGRFFGSWRQAEPVFPAEGQVDEFDGIVVASAGVLAAQWMVARTTARGVALDSMRAVQRGAWAVTAVVMAFCALGAALLIARLVNPLTLLRERTVRGLDDTVDPADGWPVATGEIGDLAHALQTVMTENASRAQALRTAAAQLEALLANAPVGLIVTRRGRIELAGLAAGDMLGYAAGELRGKPSRLIYGSDENYESSGVRIRAEFAERGFFDGELELRRKNGHSFWAQLKGRAIDAGDAEQGTIWIVQDVTEAIEARQRLSWSATHDALTGLVNRQEFEVRLAAALQGASLAEGTRELVVLFIDLDHFKAVNDTAGHAAGDAVLRHIALTMEAHVRQSDSVARLGGDEFGMLLPGCPPARAAALAERLRAAIDAWRPEFAGRSFALSLSIGLYAVDAATLPDVAAVLHAADTACYQAKRGGRNRVVVFEAGVDALLSKE